jgi:hypothetical protein
LRGTVRLLHRGARVDTPWKFIQGEPMRSALVLSLALLPPLIAAAWTWIQLQRAEKEIGPIGNFEGMHFEE